MEVVLSAVLVIGGFLNSVVAIYRANLTWARYMVDDPEAYADQHGLPLEAVANANLLACLIQFVYTVLYWLAVYALVIR